MRNLIIMVLVFALTLGFSPMDAGVSVYAADDKAKEQKKAKPPKPKKPKKSKESKKDTKEMEEVKKPPQPVTMIDNACSVSDIPAIRTRELVLGFVQWHTSGDNNVYFLLGQKSQDEIATDRMLHQQGLVFMCVAEEGVTFHNGSGTINTSFELKPGQCTYVSLPPGSAPYIKAKSKKSAKGCYRFM